MSRAAASLAEGGIGFVGAGAVATALAAALSQRGYAVRAAASRSRASALRLAARTPGVAACDDAQEVADRCAVVFLTVPDGAIAEVAGSLTWRRGQAAVHCSGATALDSLIAPRSQGAMAGGFHPLADLRHAGERAAGPGRGQPSASRRTRRCGRSCK